MATKNPDILKWKSGCFGCLQKLCKLYLSYCGGTLNYNEIDSPGSKEWMVSQTWIKECLLTSISIYVMYPMILSSPENKKDNIAVIVVIIYLLCQMAA